MGLGALALLKPVVPFGAVHLLDVVGGLDGEVVNRIAIRFMLPVIGTGLGAFGLRRRHLPERGQLLRQSLGFLVLHLEQLWSR